MARQLTTKAQVNGYRFLVRRLVHALERRDVRMIDDPMRSQVNALLVGVVVAALVLAGFGVWGLIRPQGSVGDASIIVGKSSGALYVLVDDRLHPVFNLASARLIAGSAQSPRSVADAKLGDHPRGSLLGIPGAPSSLGEAPTDRMSRWSVCDTADGPAGRHVSGLSVLSGALDEDPEIMGAQSDSGVLVEHGGSVYLLYTISRDGRTQPVRAAVDTASVEVMTTLALTGVRPRHISAGLLNTFPEVPALTVPDITDAGAAGPWPDVDASVGSVVRSVGIDDSATFFVVLRGGLQPIGSIAAEIIRTADTGDAAPVPTVSPARIASVPKISDLPVDGFPTTAPRLVDAGQAPVICHHWARSMDGGEASTRLLLGGNRPSRSEALAVVVAGADGTGPAADRVLVGPFADAGAGRLVTVTGLTPASTRSHGLYYLGESGVRFPVADLETARILGLEGEAQPVPWPMVSLLPEGPELRREAALVAHDAVVPQRPASALVSASEG